MPRAAEAGGAGPAALYRERIAAGEIHADPAQERVVARLERLHEALLDYRAATERGGLLGWLGLTEPATGPGNGEATPPGVVATDRPLAGWLALRLARISHQGNGIGLPSVS